MADTLKDQSSVSGNKGVGSAKFLRYPIRSAAKSKDEKPHVSVSTSVSAARRVRSSSSSVSQSVSVLDLSSKEKSAKPIRRLSIPTKPIKSITPGSEARANRPRNTEGKSDTPVPDASRTLSRKKFSVLSSASYWLSHIKLSEAAGKHQLSLGFFKLAQEAACENPQLLRDELKSYAIRYNIIDLGEPAKEILQSYEISETILQCTQSSSEDAQSLPSVDGIHKPKPKSMSYDIGSVAKGSYQKKLAPNSKAPTNKRTANQHAASEAGSGKMQKNFYKPIKKEFNKEKHMVNSKGKKSANEDAMNCADEEITQENKENLAASLVEEISLET